MVTHGGGWRIGGIGAIAGIVFLAARPAPAWGASPEEMLRRGEELMGAGRLREAREVLEEAADAGTGSPAFHLVLARVLFRLGDLRAARREVDLLLDLAPDSAAARDLSGDLYDREGRMNMAAGEWEAALESGGTPGLAAKLERARREMAAEEGLQRESSRYFLVLYDRDVPRDLVRGLFRMLDEAYDLLHDRLGDHPGGEIRVILYSRLAFHDATRAPEWMGGLYDGTIRVPVGGLVSAEAASGLVRVLIHEMTHAFIFRMAPSGLPRWFNEGVATAVEGQDPEHVRAWLAQHPPEGIATLEDLDRALLGQRGTVAAAYAAARLALHELEEARGFGAVRGIISGVGEGRPFAEVFREEARMDLGEFEERWRRALP